MTEIVSEVARINDELERCLNEDRLEAARELGERLLEIDAAVPLGDSATLHNFFRLGSSLEGADALKFLRKADAVGKKVTSSLENQVRIAEEQLKAIKTRGRELETSKAAQLHELASKYFNLGELDNAKAYFEKAAEIRERLLGTGHLDTAASFNELGVLSLSMGEQDRAKRLLELALATRKKLLGPRHVDTAETLAYLGLLYFRMGRSGDAHRYLKRSLSIRREADPEGPGTAESLLFLGLVAAGEGDLQTARSYLEKSQRIQKEKLASGDPVRSLGSVFLSGVLGELGDFHGARGQLEDALAGLTPDMDSEQVWTAQLLNNIGLSLQNMGDFRAAQYYYERAVAAWEASLGSENPNIAIAFSNLGTVLWLQGDLQGARPYLERALEIDEKTLGPDHFVFVAALQNLGAFLLRAGDLAAAELRLERAAALFAEHFPEHSQYGACLINLGSLYLRKGDLGKAEGYLQRALKVQRSHLGADHPMTAACLILLAEVTWLQGNVEAALESLERAMRDQEDVLAAVLAGGSEMENQTFFRSLGFNTATHLAVSMHVDSAAASRRALNLALTAVLQRKGRILDAVTRQQNRLRGHLSAESRDLFEELMRLRGSQAHLLLLPLEDVTPELRTELRELTRQVDAISRKLLATSVPFREMVAATEPRPEAVRRTLDEQTALVEFFAYRSWNRVWGEWRYVAYVLSRRQELEWVDLGATREIDAAAQDLRRGIAERRGDVRHLARRLDALTMEKIRPRLGGARGLVLSPDGLLHLVPFAALVDEEGHYLVERYRLSYVTSGSDLLRQFGAVSREEPLVVGDASFDAVPHPDPGETARGGEGIEELRWAALAGTRQEALAVGEILGLTAGRVLTGERATEASVKQVAGPRILHLATHGFFLPDLPEPSYEELEPRLEAEMRRSVPLLRSGIALSGFHRFRESENGEDGVLTALEVADLDLWGTEVVVLSACETGVGEVRTGQGVYGLRRALVLAGSKTQIMSLWQVDDEATRDLMVSWYEQLRQGVGRAEALRRIQLAILRAEPLPVTGKRLRGRGVEPRLVSEEPGDPFIEGIRHPYYWASFIVSGETGPLAWPVEPDL